MSLYDSILENLPEVEAPKEQKLSFKVKLKWTLITLILFFILGLIPLVGLGTNSLQQFEFLSTVLAASFGSIISLGIGPIVTASIVLQLLNGSGIVNFDTSSAEGKKRFQGTQKILSLFFILFEAVVFVWFGGLQPAAGYSHWALIIQLFIGGFLILMMDEVVSKWGFSSGISLFIAAGVGKEIMLKAFSWLQEPGSQYAVGAVWRTFQALSGGQPDVAGIALVGIIATIIVFIASVYAQSMKVEIPLTFGRIRGHGIRWPLNFLYTSNIPVILVAALMANIQLGTQLFGGGAAAAIGQWFQPPQLFQQLITGSVTGMLVLRSLFYMSFMMLGSAVFAAFWVQSAGMDSKSQAEQILSSGLQVPGFRKDKRVLERMLDRYIWPLAITGGIAVGILASIADLMGALSRGTGILLAVMIVYKLYEEIAQQHMMDMNPMLRKFMGK